MTNIDSATVYQRYQSAVRAGSESLVADQDDIARALLLDLRRAGVFEQAANAIPGSQWRDPSRIGEWWSELPADREVIVY